MGRDGQFQFSWFGFNGRIVHWIAHDSGLSLSALSLQRQSAVADKASSREPASDLPSSKIDTKLSMLPSTSRPIAFHYSTATKHCTFLFFTHIPQNQALTSQLATK